MHARSLWTAVLVFFLAGCGGGGGGGGGGGTGSPAGLAPAAQIFAEAVAGTLAQTYKFYGQGVDPDCDALTYAWDLDDDGAYDDSALQAPTHTFAANGTHTVGLQVSDPSGNTATATVVVAAFDSAQAAMTTTPGVTVRCHTLMGGEGLESLFIASASDDSDGGGIPSSYDWDFDGDGAFEVTGTPRTRVGTLAGPGQITVSCRANSSDGSSSVATLTVHICESGTLPDLSPGVQVEMDTEASFALTTGGTANFLASGGDIDGGTIASLNWDTDEDGLYGAGDTDGVGRTITSRPWGPTAPYRVRVTATDEEGKSSRAHSTVSVQAGPLVGFYPSAQVIALSTLASTGTPIQFIAQANDPDGLPLTIEWDIDGDRTFGDGGGSLTPTFTFTERGTYAPLLRVTDADGFVSYASLTLVVECCQPGGYGPYWWCDCDDKTLGHGAAVTCLVDCPVGTGPTEAGVIYCNGQMGLGGDPACNEVTLTDPGGGAPVGPLPAVAAPFGFGFESTAVDGPARTVGYTVGLKLREPGVRVQILKCQINVVHELFACYMPLNSSAPDHVGQLNGFVGQGANEPILNVTPVAADIVAIHFIESEQSPPWNPGMTAPPGGMSAPPGWVGSTIPGGVRFEINDPMVATPIRVGQPWHPNPFVVQFQDGGVPPQSAMVQFLDNQGNIIARQQAPHMMPPP